MPRTAEAFTTNSPSDSLAGIESEVSVPLPDTNPPSDAPKKFPIPEATSSITGRASDTASKP